MVLRALSLLLLAGAGVAQGCSRPFDVPVATTGFSVIVDGDEVRGVYPDWLREAGRAAGCEFRFPVFPRARLTMMFFQSAEADILMPASRTPDREQQAHFLPLIRLKPVLVTPVGVTAPASLAELRRRKELRALAVRSHSWGEDYDRLVVELERERRISFVSDLRVLTAMLLAGRAEFTILAATTAYAALGDEERGRFVFTPLAGLPDVDAGLYLSTRRLAPDDLERLKTVLGQAAADGSLQRSYRRYFPADVLKLDVLKR